MGTLDSLNNSLENANANLGDGLVLLILSSANCRRGGDQMLLSSSNVDIIERDALNGVDIARTLVVHVGKAATGEELLDGSVRVLDGDSRGLQLGDFILVTREDTHVALLGAEGDGLHLLLLHEELILASQREAKNITVLVVIRQILVHNLALGIAETIRKGGRRAKSHHGAGDAGEKATHCVGISCVG